MSWVWRPRMSVYHWCERPALRTKMLTWSRDTGLRAMSHSPAVRIGPGRVYNTRSAERSAREHSVRRGQETRDGQPVSAGVPAGLGRAGQARSRSGREHGVLAARERHVAIVHGVHPGAQHLADLYSVRTRAQAVLASVAAVGGAVHPDVSLQQRQIVAGR